MRGTFDTGLNVFVVVLLVCCCFVGWLVCCCCFAFVVVGLVCLNVMVKRFFLQQVFNNGFLQAVAQYHLKVTTTFAKAGGRTSSV